MSIVNNKKESIENSFYRPCLRISPCYKCAPKLKNRKQIVISQTARFLSISHHSYPEIVIALQKRADIMLEKTAIFGRKEELIKI